MYRQIIAYAKQLGMKPSTQQKLDMYSLWKQCPICQGQVNRCQAKPIECYRSWEVFGESPTIDVHKPYKIGPFLFEKADLYWKVIPLAISDPRFTCWDRGGYIFKQGQHPKEAFKK